MWHSHGGMGWWMLFGATFWLLFWVSIIWLLVSLIRPHREPVDSDGALVLARRRYASGEITREEYVRLRDVLRTTD